MSLADVALDDKYHIGRGRVFLTGTQALVRLLLMQRQRDVAAGLNTAGFVSGYRGSPLGNLDRELWRARPFLDEHHVRFLPGVNEDLAATAVWGAQQAALFPEARYDGVFAMWYGKGPGVDRSGDVFRHANLAGTSPHGGVLAIAGDDPGCHSSTVPSACEHAFIDAQIPVLSPSDVGEILDFGLTGWAMSRHAGCWVALKTTAETLDCAASVAVDVDWPRLASACDVSPPALRVHIRAPDWPPVEQERRLVTAKLEAVRVFAAANRLDRVVLGGVRGRIGIVSSGKAHRDVMQALTGLGIDAATAASLGIVVYKVGLVWPLEPHGIERFADGLEEILVVEEKRPVIETQIRALLYNAPADRRPRVVGKTDEGGAPLLPAYGELDPGIIARTIAGRLAPSALTAAMRRHLTRLDSAAAAAAAPSPLVRQPYYCAGCPHNTSTVVPEGSRAVAGIGCHFMVTWMHRHSDIFTHMGGEGASWLGTAPFVDRPHVFVNVGDGTYFHSGILGIRAAVAAAANITFKILYNDAVAMTGGQPVDGPLDVPTVTRQVAAEGVRRIAVVAETPEKYLGRHDLAKGTTVHARDDLDAVQRDLRALPGPSVLIYDQTCAAEKRRRRKRSTLEDPPTRVFINPLVCEGCGDCGVKSNCVAIEPLETEFGRKRQVNQSACNKDYSCLKGFCPSFVTVTNGRPRRGASLPTEATTLPEPPLPLLTQPFGIVVAGIGGTGVVTLGAILGMAAHLEGKAVTVLDSTGLAQKNGAVYSHVRIAASESQLDAAQVPVAGADTLLGCDLVTAASPQVVRTLAPGRSAGIINAHATMTAQFTHAPDLAFPDEALRARISQSCGDSGIVFLDFSRLATALFGDAVAANAMVLGMAYQRGLLPVTAAAIERAIAINGVAVAENTRAFAWGRRAALDPTAVRQAAGLDEASAGGAIASDLGDIVAVRVRELTAYADADYAERYRGLVERVRAVEAERVPGSQALSVAVARSLFKLMACKDEYEVARLFTDGRFAAMLSGAFEGEVDLTFHLAPPLLARRDAGTGEPNKLRYGAWLMIVFRLLARMKKLRGTVLDPFAYGAERRMERRLLADYESTVAELLACLDGINHPLACEIAALPESIRGFGHVKAASAAAAALRAGELMAAFRRPADTAHAA